MLDPGRLWHRRLIANVFGSIGLILEHKSQGPVQPLHLWPPAAVVELADTIRSGRIARKGVEVRILSAAWVWEQRCRTQTLSKGEGSAKRGIDISNGCSLRLSDGRGTLGEWRPEPSSRGLRSGLRTHPLMWHSTRFQPAGGRGRGHRQTFGERAATRRPSAQCAARSKGLTAINVTSLSVSSFCVKLVG